MRYALILTCFIATSSCTSSFLSRSDREVPTSTLESLHELRAEMAQLTHLIHGQSVDIQLLEEKLSNLSLKKRELLSENLTELQQKVDQIESVLANVRMHTEQVRKQQQQVVDAQLQRLVSLENKVTQHDSSLHIIKDLKQMMGQLKAPQTYRVESGDTLEGISRRYGLKTQDLKEINQLQSDQIQTGQILKIPL